MIRRRELLLGGAAVIAGALPRLLRATQPSMPGPRVSIANFGARTDAADNAAAVQAAIDSVQHGGGGTVVIPGRFRCGQIRISGSNVRLEGQDGALLDTRLIITSDASNIEVADLKLIETTGTGSYLLDVSGRNCRFHNLELAKDPPARGYQMYVRQPAQSCSFDGLRLRGSLGIFLAGIDHSFENFVLESRAAAGKGAGDDAFAIKAVSAPTQNITIRNGVVRGFSAIVSFGSEIGRRGNKAGPAGAVRNVTVENLTGEKCARVAFLKPGALSTDWRDGLLEGIRLRNLSLTDPGGEQFRCGIQIIAARGATIRDVEATGISIKARAKDSGVVRTAAVSILLLDKGAPATIEDVALQVQFADPYESAPHGDKAPGFPIDWGAQVARRKQAKGTMAKIVLDLDARGTAFGGISIGAGLDGAVTIKRAALYRVGTKPPRKGGAAIRSDSRVTLGDVTVDASNVPKFGGSAFVTPHTAR